jgi:hypothetical protein
MRARYIVQVLSVTVVVAVGAVWMESRATALELEARLVGFATLRRNTARALQQERDRLRSALAEANRRREADAATPSVAFVPIAPPPAVAPVLALGEWRSAGEWRNEGQATPRSTVSTLLWSAAGGDLNATMQLLAFDEAGRKQAQILFDRLPAAARLSFPTPEALVAGLTIQAVPEGAAQLSWLHHRDSDHATVGLLLGATEQSAPAVVRVEPARGNDPPALVNPQASNFTALSLQRSSRGWLIVIPAAAIERLARQYKVPAD